MNSNRDANISDVPSLKYSFNATGQNSQLTAVAGWFCQKYPDKMKSLALAFPDNQLGHILSTVFGGTWKASGVSANVIYYPASQQDLSSLGTKVAVANPAMFMTVTGGDVTDAQVMNAVIQAGYKGQMFNIQQTPLSVLNQLLTPQALEGYTTWCFTR